MPPAESAKLEHLTGRSSGLGFALRTRLRNGAEREVHVRMGIS